MKEDKAKPLSLRQRRQLDTLGIPWTEEMTVHEASRLASQALQPKGTKREKKVQP